MKRRKNYIWKRLFLDIDIMSDRTGKLKISHNTNSRYLRRLSMQIFGVGMAQRYTILHKCQRITRVKNGLDDIVHFFVNFSNFLVALNASIPKRNPATGINMCCNSFRLGIT